MKFITQSGPVKLLLCLSLLILSCSGKNSENRNGDFLVSDPVNEKSDTIIDRNYSIEIFKREDNFFGYNILKNGKTIIHQPHLPGVAGKRGFSSEADAKLVASLAVTKINRQIFPPTITRAELDSLGVLN